jgi:glycosyltransferase 2 family protein
MSKKSLINLLLKIVISGFALYYVFSRINLHDIAEKVSNSNPFYLIAALLVYALSQLVSAFRLKVLFKYVPIPVSHLENLKLYWLGLFYNLFLPGGVGGDGFKVYLIGKHLKTELKKTIGAILSDRVSGLSIIVILLLIFAPFIDYNIPLKAYAWAGIPFVAAGFFLFLYIFNRTLTPAYWPTMSWAALAQLLQMVSAILILNSLDTDASAMYDAYLFLFFLSAIAGAVPITLGGIGAREVVFMWGAQYLGVDESSAIALSLLFYTASAVTALPGLIFSLQPSSILGNNTMANSQITN